VRESRRKERGEGKKKRGSGGRGGLYRGEEKGEDCGGAGERVSVSSAEHLSAPEPRGLDGRKWGKAGLAML